MELDEILAEIYQSLVRLRELRKMLLKHPQSHASESIQKAVGAAYANSHTVFSRNTDG